jgi:protein-tyrosine phosphatase
MMNPEDRDLEDRQESEIRQKEGGRRGGRGVGDDESNRVPSEEDQAALVQRLLEENARLKQEYKEQLEEDARLEQEYKEQYKERALLLEENAKLKNKLARLSEEDARLEQKYKEMDENASVKRLLETHNGIPPMKTNTSAKSFMGAGKKPSGGANNTLKCNQTERGAAVKGASENIDNEGGKVQQHAPANIENMQERVLDYMEQFPLNLRDKEGNLVKSMIAPSMGGKSANKEATLSNFNEASTFLHVIHLLQDVFQCLGLPSSVDIAQEVSMFSMRRNLVVVRWKNIVILVIKVKNAGKDGKLFCEDGNAAGKAYDYSMGLCQMGIERPFVCLSTYEYMRIGTVQSSSKDIFSEAVKRLETGKIRHVDSGPYHTPQKVTISPEKQGNLTPIPHDSKTTQLEDEKEIGKAGQREQPKRVIYFSEIFDRTNIFKALCFALVCGLVAAEKSTNDGNETLVPKEGAQIQKCVAVVSKKASLYWEHLDCKATYQLKSRWSEDMRVFLHCVLGQGRSGKVYLASDSSGRMFAVKLYLYDSMIVEYYRVNKNRDETEVAMEIRDDEAEIWKKSYPSFEKAIFSCELVGVPCLAMPYVAPIPTTRRKCLLPKIRNELEKFAERGLAYRVSDLYWRYIGLRTDEEGKEQIILVDLESMRNDEQGEEESIFLDDLEAPLEEEMKIACDAINPAILELENCADNPVGTPREFIHA